MGAILACFMLFPYFTICLGLIYSIMRLGVSQQELWSKELLLGRSKGTASIGGICLKPLLENHALGHRVELASQVVAQRHKVHQLVGPLGEPRGCAVEGELNDPGLVGVVKELLEGAGSGCEWSGEE